MEQEQSEVIEYFVKKTFASSNANALASILVEATSHRNLFTFSEILSLSNLQQLKASENSVYLDMLRLFAYGTWSDYTKNAGRLPQLIPDQILKLKQLTVLTLARTYEVLLYDQMMQELDVTNVHELQDFLIDECMYSGLVRGKLDHLRQCFVVQFAACRDLRPAKLGSMIETLSNWLSTSENLLVSIQEKIIWADARDEIEKKHRKCVEENLQEAKNILVKLRIAAVCSVQHQDYPIQGIGVSFEVAHCKQANFAFRNQEDNEVPGVLKSILLRQSLGILQEAAYNILNIAMDDDVQWMGVLVACLTLNLGKPKLTV